MFPGAAKAASHTLSIRLWADSNHCRVGNATVSLTSTKSLPGVEFAARGCMKSRELVDWWT